LARGREQRRATGGGAGRFLVTRLAGGEGPGVEEVEAT